MATYSESEAGATESVVYYYQQYAEVGSIYAVTKPMVEDAAKTVGRDFAINKTSEVVANIAYPYNEENRETTEKGVEGALEAVGHVRETLGPAKRW